MKFSIFCFLLSIVSATKLSSQNELTNDIYRKDSLLRESMYLADLAYFRNSIDVIEFQLHNEKDRDENLIRISLIRNYPAFAVHNSIIAYQFSEFYQVATSLLIELNAGRLELLEKIDISPAYQKGLNPILEEYIIRAGGTLKKNKK